MEALSELEAALEMLGKSKFKRKRSARISASLTAKLVAPDGLVA